jgi:probable phosphoglycerate mutase
VRHGESTWNAEDRLQGQADPPLSARGRAQAEESLDRVRAFAPDTVVSSDLVRAVETAAILGYADPVLDRRWREVDIGEWTARIGGEVRAETPEAFAAWRAGRRPAPGGEEHPAFFARVEAAARELLDGEGTALVICHGGPIRVTCAALLGVDLRQLAGVGNGSTTVLEHNGTAIRLVAYNQGGEGSETI